MNISETLAKNLAIEHKLDLSVVNCLALCSNNIIELRDSCETIGCEDDDDDIKDLGI